MNANFLEDFLGSGEALTKKSLEDNSNFYFCAEISAFGGSFKNR